MNIKDHADKLAQALQVMAPDAPELRAYRDACAVDWVKASEVCEKLRINPRTLVRWRQENKIEEGVHWRRMGISRHCVYSVPAIAQVVGPV
jgi:hypothetical protein